MEFPVRQRATGKTGNAEYRDECVLQPRARWFGKWGRIILPSGNRSQSCLPGRRIGECGGGIVCDGAKPSCAAKIAASVHAALLAHYMSMSDKQFQAGEGIVEKNVEETIKNMGYIGRVGMKSTDKEILNVMIDKADVDANL